MVAGHVLDAAVSPSPSPPRPANPAPAAEEETPSPAPCWVVHAHDRLGSTSDEARRLARLGAPHGTAVWAKAQTAGRGRRGRAWSSPEGNLHVSLVLHCAQAVAPQLGFVAVLAVADAVDAACGRPLARLKWPNDVLLGGAKLAGLLLEAEHTDHGPVVVLGIGINLRHFPTDAGYAATSLHAHDVEVEAATMLEALLRLLGVRLREWVELGFDRVQTEWSRRGHRKDDALRISASGGRVDGTFVGLDRDGSLLALVEDRVERFTSAEILSA